MQRQAVNHVFNGLGELTGVNGNTTVSLGCLPGGLLETIGNGSFEETYPYNARKQLASVESDKDSSLITRFAHSDDGRGNRLTEDDQNAQLMEAEITEYGYDGADRLTGVRYPDAKDSIRQPQDTHEQPDDRPVHNL